MRQMKGLLLQVRFPLQMEKGLPYIQNLVRKGLVGQFFQMQEVNRGKVIMYIMNSMRQ